MKKKIEKHLPGQCLLLTNNPFVYTHSTQCSTALPHLVGTAIIRHLANQISYLLTLLCQILDVGPIGDKGYSLR